MSNFNDNDFYIGEYTLLDKIELMGQKCVLKHGPKNMNFEQPEAINYLSQYFGYNKDNSVTELLRIPICEECIRGLYNRDWVLLYCIACNSSQWVFKPMSRLNYNTNVVWMDACPECSQEE